MSSERAGAAARAPPSEYEFFGERADDKVARLPVESSAEQLEGGGGGGSPVVQWAVARLQTARHGDAGPAVTAAGY